MAVARIPRRQTTGRVERLPALLGVYLSIEYSAVLAHLTLTHHGYLLRSQVRRRALCDGATGADPEAARREPRRTLARLLKRTEHGSR